MRDILIAPPSSGSKTLMALMLANASGHLNIIIEDPKPDKLLEEAKEMFRAQEEAAYFANLSKRKKVKRKNKHNWLEEFRKHREGLRSKQ